jgi:hypothetical protein
MKTRWLVEIAVTALGMLTAAACATGNSPTSSGFDGEGGNDGPTGSSSSSSSSSSGSAGSGGAGGDGGSSSGGAGGASTSSTSSASSSSSSSSGMCAETPCKLVAPQCGCASGESCTIDGTASGTRLCVPAGSVAIGGQCMGGSTCAPGGFCIYASATIATCVEFCASDSDCTAPGGLCAVTLNSSSGQIPNVTLCSENCDPTTNVGCPVTGMACQVLQESTGLKRSYTRCGAAGTGTQGASCMSTSTCAPTYGCFSINSNPSTCVKYCKVGGAACPGTATCSPVGTIGSTGYGICI